MKNQRNHLTNNEKIKIIEEAIANKKIGGSYAKVMLKYGVSDGTFYNAKKLYDSGKLLPDDEEIPSKLSAMVADEIERQYDENKQDFLIHSGDIKNNLRITVELPSFEDKDEYNLELQRRIVKKLRWCFAIESFEFDFFED